jgi:hypothetical protein
VPGESKSNHRPKRGNIDARPLLWFLKKRRRVLLVVIVAAASARIVSTYNVFSHTFDEPAHIGCGMEWLADGAYTLEPQHPPLARVAAAIGPYLAGARVGALRDSDTGIWRAGLDVLYQQGQYRRMLLLARLGTLPFFWVACAVVYLWGRRYFGPAVGVLAVLFFSLLPPVLAHAGLATTDMACTAFLGAAFLSACILLEEPSPRHAAIFGLCGGLALLSKFSAPVFFVAAAAIARFWYLAVEQRRHPASRLGTSFLRLFAVAVAVGGVVVWAGYRFSIAHGIPAPEFWVGLGQLKGHVIGGDHAYLLGRLSDSGFWYFFPVALAVKTPIGFLLLAAGGIVLAVRDRRIRSGLPVALCMGILGVAMVSPIDIGVRHILPIFLGLSLLAARAVAYVWSAPGRAIWLQAGVAVLLVWLAVASVSSHPDYLAYFNEFAGSHPEKILVDSDLDWGQDVTRLASRLHALGARHVTFANFAYADFRRQPGFEGIEVDKQMPIREPAPGWNAVSVTMWKKSMRYSPLSPVGAAFWANRVPPRERVGKSIYLWYFDDSARGVR